MKKILIILIISSICFAGFSSNYEQAERKEHKESATLEDLKESNRAEPFDIMMQVIAHKRCINCHPSGDRPHQGEDSHVHNFNVQRGEDGHGMATAQCSTCHQEENNDYSGVPGAPHWHLAPKSMAWEGLSRVQIAEAMLDKSKNGGRSVEEIEKHLTEDHLVLWVFEPGINSEGEPREKPPVSKEDYIKAVKDWVASGAEIPAK